MTTITVCMGSSCYSRGNKENVQIIKNYIEENGLDAGIKITGILCSDNCGKGPVITINDKMNYHVDQPVLSNLLGEL